MKRCMATCSPSTYLEAAQMVVNYVSHAGKAPWWNYDDQSIGRGGTASVDLFNGNLVYVHADTATGGNLMPVSVTHYYNSCLSAENKGACGMGWRTSAHQSVYRTEIGGKRYYVWMDGSGTEHWFLVSTTENPNQEQWYR